MAPWAGYALSMLCAVFLIIPRGVFSRNLLVLYGVSGVVWALLLSLGYRPSRRNKAPRANREEQAPRMLQRPKRTRLRNRERKDFNCIDCGAQMRFGASYCGHCDAELEYSNGS